MIPIYEYGQVPNSEIFARDNIASNVEGAVTEILAQVAARGDEALREYTLRFDKADLTNLEVTEAEIDEAFAAVEPEFVAILEQAAANIRAFHEKQRRNSFVVADQPGVVLGQKIVPIQKVGLYVPGGTAAYPSTVLMDSIPAKIAGCPQLVMVTPPGADGKVNPVILAAAKIAGVDRIFKVGGAQAVAGLAFGTETLPRVDKIVGPGNAYVAEAKKQVFGRVAIDMIAGPSEILVLSDGGSNPRWVAADLLSQAEHDVRACAVLVTNSPTLAQAVQAEVERQLASLPRCEVARKAIDANSKIIVTDSLEQALEAANRIAPEHLELCVDDPFALLPRVRNAGSIFLGRSTPEALGDYLAGPNHTLPTSGTARFSSPLSVDDFVKKSSFLYYDQAALSPVAERIADFARREGLEAHARSALIRRQSNEEVTP